MNIARVIYGGTTPDSSLYNADLRWRIRMRLHDPHFYVEFPEAGREAVLIASALEINRARKEARGVQIESAEELRKDGVDGEPLGALAVLLRRRETKEIIFHPDTPVEIVELLRDRFSMAVGKRPWYPERIIKTEEEILYIKEAIAVTEDALDSIKNRLAKTTIEKGIVYENGGPLTSQMVRDSIEHTFFKKGFFSSGAIISSGREAADPHAMGEGEIKEGSPIVCDIFPYSRASGYFADITRTFFKGTPLPHVTKAYEAVLSAQEKGISLLKAGIDGSEVHGDVLRILEERGFRTDPIKGEGFIHATGHGVGLECHEILSVGPRKESLPAGAVVTVEPGLYYPDESFGIRIEDMVLVEQDGHRVLSTYPKDLASAIIE